MANNNNEGAENNPDTSKDSGLEKSFVEKFMSGIINSTPLTKWFWKDSPPRSTIRRREEDEDYDASFTLQPPSKRAKLPTDLERNNYSAHVFESPVTVHTSNNVNNVTSKVLGKFPEPVPGPSGIRSRKLFEKHNTSSTNTISIDSLDQLEVVNGEQDSDSGESTSGYSSAPKLLGTQKNEDNSKETTQRITPRTRSLFTPTDPGGKRTLFPDRSPQMNTSLSSRRPAFNASTFGSPNFVDRTLSTKRILNSPFYSGRTIYGGASAYGRKFNKNLEEPTRTSVQIKPVNEKKEKISDNTTLSKTARRILNTLEQYSTPISDAKKIPVTPRKQGLLSNYVGATPYLVSGRRKPLNRELQVPTVPDLLQMKQKERLQCSTESVRQIATKSQSSLNKEEYKLRVDDNNKQKHSNKMRNSVASARQRVQPIEPVSEVKLPKVSLPITTLPKFDFVMMPSINPPNKEVPEVIKPPTSTITKPTVVFEKKETEKKVPEKTNTNTFIFSEPLVIAKDLKSIAAINCFKFSEPLSKKQTETMLMFRSSSSDSGYKSGSLKMKNNGENVSFVIAKSAPHLLSGSVMDVLGKKKENQLKQTEKWECPTCLVRNEADKTQCCACDEPKPEKEEKSFGEQFKLSSDKWECSSCLVRNNKQDTKCVACASPKPSEKPVVASGFGDKFKPPASTCGTANLTKAPSNLFGDKFKPPGDTWACDVCMIRNKNSDDKCIACETPKPGSKTQKPVAFFNSTGTTFSFGIKQEWECKTCMIKNKNDVKKCAACEMPRDDTNKAQIGFGDAFKKKSDEWECTSCMVKNKATDDSCVCCGVPKPGKSGKLAEISEEKKPVNSFNFGIDKAQFKFGIPTGSEAKESVASTTPTFSFGAPAATSSTFSFGVKAQEKSESPKPAVSEATSSNPLLKPSEKLPEKAVAAPVGFKFGLEKNSQSNEKVVHSKTETTPATTFSTSFTSTAIPTFQFKPTAVNGDINKSKDAESNKSGGFGSDLNKPKETTFSEKSKESPFGKTESSFGSNKKADSPFGTSSKPSDSHFGKPTESPFGGTKPTDTSFGGTKPTDPSFGSTSKSVNSPFSKPTDSFAASKLTESPFRNSESPFNKPNKPTDAPFGAKLTESPFGVNKPTDSPFANAPDSKPKETVFGTPNNGSKPPSGLFGSNEASKPAESLFNTPNKPKEVIFGNKPAESSNLFGAPTSTPPFSFTPKPAESAASTFTPAASTSQPAASGIFKFGPEASNSNKRMGDPVDNPLSNGFGSAPKVPAFGTSQSFTENKPFAFGGESTPKTSGFSFGQTEKPKTTAPIFNFGSGATASSAASPPPSSGFNFNVTNTAFNFGGSTAKAESQTFNPPSNMFGSTGTGAKNGNFNFGTTASNNNEKAVFSFGANQTSQPNQQGFPPQQQQQGQAGFNFGAPAPLNPQIGAFNFTGAPPSFSFTDGNSAQSQPPRKIKKALRRTHR